MARKSESSIKLVSQRDLRLLAEQCDGYKKKADSATGNMRELIGEYVTKKNLHKGAFSWAMKLRRMESGELWLFLAHFDDYRQKFGIDRLASEQAQMLPSGAEESDGKVTRMRPPRQVDETPGEAAE